LKKEKSMNAFKKTILPTLIAAAVLAGAATAAEHTSPSGMPEPSRETREKMATLHERMAACLRSDKSVSDCRHEMQQHCRTMMGAQNCPMMGMDKRHDMTDPPPAQSQDKTHDKTQDKK
jgi:hypothetical protein